MNKFRLISVFVVLAMVFSFANVSPAGAATTTIANPSFEVPDTLVQFGNVPGWNSSGYFGIFEAGNYGQDGIAPDGNQVAFVNTANGQGWQTLSDSFSAGSGYQLNFYTSARSAPGASDITVVVFKGTITGVGDLNNANIVKLQVFNAANGVEADQFKPFSVSVSASDIAAVGAAGQPIGIGFFGPAVNGFGNTISDTSDFDIDNVVLATTTAVTLQEGTATFSQGDWCCNLNVDEAVDGQLYDYGASGIYNGWATYNVDHVDAQTAVWETASDVDASRLDFNLYHTWAASHSLGRFRLSYTTDDRSTFADGLNSNGDVDANWTVLTGATISGTGGETFTELADGSILVSGPAPATTIYSVSFSGSFSGITGIRLESLKDPSLPYGGPGRGGNGNWHLVEITLDATAPTDTSAPTATVTSVSPAANGLGWNNTDVTVTWNWSDEAGGSGIDNAACTTSSTSTGEGEITLTATCKDLAGNEGSASYTVKVDKTLPVADAGSDQSIHAGYTVNLDGGASSDDNTLPEELSYNWSFFSTPAGNTATLNNADTATPSFTPNVSGEYVVQLIVTDDADNDSEAVFVTLSSLNMAPTADAAATPMLPLLGQSVSLDGSASSDPDGDAIYYQWAVTSKPVGSAASLTNATSAIASITPDVSGTYEMTLTVSDFLESGAPLTVSFVASTAEEFAQVEIIEVSTSVVALEPAEITTAGNQEAFGNFLTNTMSQIQGGKVDKAIADLEKAIARTDGCALRGSPDGKGAGMDWVTTCDAQASIYDSLVAALEALQY